MNFNNEVVKSTLIDQFFLIYENMSNLNPFCENVIGLFKHLRCKPKSSNIISLNTNLKCLYNMD